MTNYCICFDNCKSAKCLSEQECNDNTCLCEPDCVCHCDCNWNDQFGHESTCKGDKD